MIVLASDHAGFKLKEKIKKHLQKLNLEFEDLGTTDTNSVDYPIYAKKMALYMKDRAETKGILICGTGIGMSIAINRFYYIRGALCKDKKTAILCRQHNDANVLILAGRNKGTMLHYRKIVKAFLNTKFLGDRHQRRVDMLIDLAKEQN